MEPATKTIQQILNGAITSLTNVLPMRFDVLAPILVTQPYEQKELGVLIGLVGDASGRLIIDTTLEVVSSVGEAMFGMAIEGEMVESFAGELGNMVAGNLCIVMEKEETVIDISPPTVMKGETKIYGFQHAFKLPIRFENGTMLNVLLALDEK